MIIQEYNEQLQRSVHQFMRTVRTLSDEQFLQPMNGWSPRDVVAHLLGWNWVSIDIADAIRRGEAPQALIDPGEDFSKANAAFVRQYDSTGMIDLLRQLELSYQAMASHLYTVDVEDWTRTVAVPGMDTPVTIEWYVRELTEDYENHRQEIEKWRQEAAPG
jgi:hypothetical protein